MGAELDHRAVPVTLVGDAARRLSASAAFSNLDALEGRAEADDDESNRRLLRCVAVSESNLINLIGIRSRCRRSVSREVESCRRIVLVRGNRRC